MSTDYYLYHGQIISEHRCLQSNDGQSRAGFLYWQSICSFDSLRHRLATTALDRLPGCLNTNFQETK